jgi:diguanylate cyclase (GGDEF)-like protein
MRSLREGHDGKGASLLENSVRTSGLVGQLAGSLPRTATIGVDEVTNPPSLRVILIGRTGLDARLRLDPTLELLRAATPLEALGELSLLLQSSANPESDASPTTQAPAPVLLLAPSADPTFTGPNGQRELHEFVASVKRLAPLARVLYVGRAQDLPGLAVLDGTIAPEVSPDQLRQHLRAFAHAPSAATTDAASTLAPPAIKPSHFSPPEMPTTPFPPTPIPATPIVETPVSRPDTISRINNPSASPGPAVIAAIGLPTSSAPASPPSLRPDRDLEIPFEPTLAPMPSTDQSSTESRALWSETGDQALVRSLLQGKDILPVALELIKTRLGGHAVRFSSVGDGEGSPVLWRGRSLGRLALERGSATQASSSAKSLGDLAPHASWLGSWLAMRDQHQQLRQAAFTDALTGAYNRRFFDFFLRSTLDEAKLSRRGVTLMLFDLDDFKRFNDQHGHDAGDEILIQTVRLLKSVIRPSDKVCRIGGDEFAVIFYDPAGPRSASSRQPSEVSQIAHRFQREIRLQKFPKLGDQAPGQLTVSAGLATYPWDGRTPEDLVRAADALAMASKKQGKNAITLGPSGDRTIEQARPMDQF